MPACPPPHNPRLRRPLMRWAAALLALAAFPATAQTPLPLASPEVEHRVEDLLGRMTLEEKVGQLSLVPNSPSFSREDVRAGRVGAVSALSRSAEIAAVQDAARASRLGIPLMVGLDVVHGYRTIFPLGLAEAGSFDPALGRAAAEMSAREARAQGYNWTFAPMADLARDVRWGRGIEGFGEDVLLGSLFTRARVEGYRAGGLLTSLKHFAGYGAAVGGRDYDATEIAPGTLFDTYLPPFRAGIDAGAETVMGGFHTLNGVPATASPFLLTDVLRGRLGFRGFVVSDWQAINQLVPHGVARDDREAALRAIRAGTDMDMAGDAYAKNLMEAVRSGALPARVVDEAARRVLRVKVASGLMDRPAQTQAPDEIPAPSPEARALARRLAQDTIVLLRNDGTLPLEGAGRRIALVGAIAASGQALLGPHPAAGQAEDTATVLAAMTARATRAGMTLVHAPGCDAYCPDADGFAEAEAAARAADVVVAVMGEDELMTGEGGSRAHLTLPGRQGELLARLLETGKPVILVLVGARPLELGSIGEKLAGLMMAWFPGTEGGTAIADILFGDVDPNAKLPVSWPRTIGQVPLYYDRLPTGRPHEPGNKYTLRYADEKLGPLFPFGFGQTYTRFAVSDARIGTASLARDGSLSVSARLTNEGSRAGREVVQLYLRREVASVSRPVRRLRAFAKVALQPGESRTVTLRVPAAELGFHRDDGSYVIEPGRFEAYLGTSSEAPSIGTFDLVE